MTFLAAIACGAVIGLVLGALGGGGSILAVPALVYALGQSAQEATTASLVIVGLSSAVSAIGYHRDLHVRWRTGAIFAVLGLGASFGGTVLNRQVGENTLLSAFAAVMALSSAAMVTKSLRERPTRTSMRRPSGPPAGTEGGGTTVLVAPPRATTPHRRPALKTASQVALAALLVGFLTGFLGVGGGFIVVPALVMILGYSMPVAAGTSLLIITLNSATSLALHASGQLHFDWMVIAPFTVATIITAQIGRRVAARFSSQELTMAFAVVLLVVGAGIGLEVALPYLTSA